MDADELDGWPWPAQRRETGLVEHACPHGIGHPNPGSVLWQAEQTVRAVGGEVETVEETEAAFSVHGCDGCCQHPSFPGYREALGHAHGLIRDGLDRENRLLFLAGKVVIEIEDDPELAEQFGDIAKDLRAALGWPEQESDGEAEPSIADGETPEGTAQLGEPDGSTTQ